MVKVDLTDSEAELFKKFRQYQTYWEKIFAIKDGSAELHFDTNGKLCKVGYHDFEKVIHTVDR